MSTAEEAAARASASKGKGMALIFGAALCYGTNAPYAREASFGGVRGPDIAALRVFIALALIAAAAWSTRTPLGIARRERAKLIGLGIASALVGICYLSSVAFIPVGVAVMIFYTYPTLVLLLSPLIDGTRLRPLTLVVFALAFAGIALAVGPSFQSLDWRGLTLATLASGAATAQMFFAARAPGGGGLATMFWVQVIILPVALLIAASTGRLPTPAAFAAAWWPSAMTILLYLFGFAFQIRGARLIPAALIGLISCFEPVTATLAAAWLLDERLGLAQYAGSALVIAAVALNILSDRTREI
ncbi:DMT family transporter [Methylovirgula sp. 4M-Z18]|uniref:DMT family transporter n=1 Tax=Methylovirgula sp. 4M-Z18 TaxID=2293567 RepID=UPI000E2FCF10|nr:DMT family transporter [Methylovirgula sp. 4M-Z18]RFB75014.1 DMT family transporter [Methylovirgula sp. 4M-Z18]